MRTKMRWRPVCGYPDYEVSDAGEVRSRTRIISDGRQLLSRTMRPGVMGPKTCQYLGVVLRQDGKSTSVGVAALVLETFRGPRPTRYKVCYADLDFSNCRLSNLSWGPRTGECHHRAKLTDIEVQAIRDMLAAGERQVVIAQAFEISQAQISAIKRCRSRAGAS